MVYHRQSVAGGLLMDEYCVLQPIRVPEKQGTSWAELQDVR